MPFEKQIKQPICEGSAPGMCGSASGTGTAQLLLESSTRLIPWARAGLGYTTEQLSTCVANNYRRRSAKIPGRKEGHSN